MKRIIEGKTYNTETSTIIATWHGNQSILFVTRGGAFFITKNEDGETYFRAVDRDEAEQWARGEMGQVELHNADIFSEPPEAAAEDPAKPESTIYVRVPQSLKQSADAAAAQSGQSVNAWVMRCIEGCLDQQRQEQAEADRLNEESSSE